MMLVYYRRWIAGERVAGRADFFSKGFFCWHLKIKIFSDDQGAKNKKAGSSQLGGRLHRLARGAVQHLRDTQVEQPGEPGG